MHSSKNSPPTTHDPFTGWGAIAGAGLGLCIGLFAGHWIAWSAGVAVAGWLLGALVDRARRP